MRTCCFSSWWTSGFPQSGYPRAARSPSVGAVAHAGAKRVHPGASFQRMGVTSPTHRTENVRRRAGAVRRLLSSGAPRYFRSLAHIWGHPGVSRLRIRLNPRLTATVARLHIHDSIVEFSLAVANLDARDRREVICHEAAHFVVWQTCRRAVRPHGPEWAALVKLAGFKPKARRVRCGLSRRRPVVTYAFRHICPVCHYSKRAARQMPRWRCPECRAIGLDGSLRIEQVSR
jgi:predicted SprT family Zn-dependent metalloprotease